METLQEYQTITSKIIGRLNTQYKFNLFSDQDLVGNIVTAVMLADFNFDGRGTLYGYRRQMAEWAVNHYFAHSKIKGIVDGDWVNTRLETLNSYSPSEQAELKETSDLIERAIGDSELTDRQEQCIRLRFYSDKTYIEIANIIGTSKQSVQQSVKNSLSKLKKHIPDGV